jgi:hypothetical protein
MFSDLKMTFLELKCVLTKMLQSKNTKNDLSKEDYNKLLQLDKEVRQLNYDNTDIIILNDNGIKITIEKA